MPFIHYAGHALSVPEGASVLETLLAAKHRIPNSCRSGTCQSCIMQLLSGEVEPQAQKGLKDSWQAQGLFLACQCRPKQDIEITLPDAEQIRLSCRVTGHQRLAGNILRLRLRPDQAFDYYPGQHVTLWRNASLGRSYSLASVPALDGEELEFHIKAFPNGQISRWLSETVAIGDRIALQGPGGDCFYTGTKQDQALLLAGIGTGLAPLYGILRDALHHGHTGQIHLYHGAVDTAGLYLHPVLRDLTESYQNFHYHPCTLSSSDRDPAIQALDIADLLRRERNDLKGWRVYLCGPDEFVKKQKKSCFLAGAGIKEIYSDAFITNPAHDG